MGQGGLGASRELLLEREGELERLRALLVEAIGERGSLAVIEGPPGIGKTTLLRTVATEAASDGFTVLSARAHELEASFAFGVVRQLFEPCVTGVSRADREALFSGAASLAADLVDPTRIPGSTSAPADPFARLHGLYWLTANLAERGPLVLLVDDVHWSDQPSVQWLGYLAHRLDGVRALVVLAARTTAPDAPVEWLEEIRHRGEATVLRPTALSAPACARLLTDLVGAEWAPNLIEELHGATGGNPFLLRELGRELTRAGSVSDPDVIDRLGSVTPETIARNVQHLLARLSDDARRVAEAVAVLGDDAQLRHVIGLVERPERTVMDAADELRSGGVLDTGQGFAFTHPVVRDAVYHGLPPGRRAEDHRHAARLFASEPAGVQSAARHLLAVPPTADSGTVKVLKAAAKAAVKAGSPEIAATYLQRALDEPPAPGQHTEVLLQLGRAERSAGLKLQAAAHLEAAARSTRDPVLRRAALAPLVSSLTEAAQPSQAFRLAREALALLPPGAGDPAEGELVFMGCMHGLAVPEVADEAAALLELPRTGPDGEMTPAEIARILLAAQTAALRCERLRAVEELDRVTAVIAGFDDPASLSATGFVQAWLGIDEIARTTLDRALVATRRAGEVGMLANVLQAVLNLHLRAGDLTAGMADSELLASLSARLQTRNFIEYGRALEVLFLLELGEVPHAVQLLEDEDRAREGPQGPWNQLWWSYAKAAVALARGAWPEARQRALALGRLLDEINVTSPDYIPWRSLAARALLNEGDRALAITLANEELGLARRASADRAIGVALVTLGVVEDSLDTRVDALQEAVTVLCGTRARLERARALCELGSTLRRANRRRDAREPLQEAIALARACGAAPLTERAHAELRATGARPRRLVFSGVAALTARERQIVELAADGQSNPEIAQALFVTRKTVETHLGSAYRKLGITNRQQLAEALDHGGEQK